VESAERVSAETAAEAHRPGLADGLVLAAESFLASGALCRKGGERTQLFVHLCEDRLGRDDVGRPPSPHPTGAEAVFRATLSDGSVLSGPALLRLACDAGLVVAKVDGAGNVLDVGRKLRSVSPALERALWIRDGGCRFPGCSARAFCEAHHIEHWAAGGATSLANTCLLCRFHHGLLHEGGFRVERDAEGGLRFFDPHEKEILGSPRAPAIVGGASEGPADARVNFPRWDGAPPDYGACVGGLVARTLH
jgi:hypothetical protein